MKRTIEVLKTFFETGDIPTQEQFWDWIDSYHHLDDGLIVKNKEILQNGNIQLTFNDDSVLLIPLAAIATLISQASNGLTKNGQTVMLGGDLTANTDINLTDKILKFLAAGTLLEVKQAAIQLLAATVTIVGDTTKIEGKVSLEIVPNNNAANQIGFILTKATDEGRAIWAPAYVPMFNVSSFDPEIMASNTSNIITIQGDFLDSITSVSALGVDDNNGVSAQVQNSTPTTLEVEIVTNALEQDYTLTLNSASNQMVLNLVVINQTILIPGSNGLLWENVALPVTTSSGSISADNSVWNWNKSATFGAIPANTDGLLSFTYDGGGNPVGMFGLNSDPATNPSWNSIDYALFISGANIAIYENGSARGGVGTIAAGDEIELKRESNVITYYKNGTLLYTSNVQSTDALHFDCSLYRDIGVSNLKLVY